MIEDVTCCKDCENYETFQCESLFRKDVYLTFHKCTLFDVDVEEDDYCSRAERKNKCLK